MAITRLGVVGSVVQSGFPGVSPTTLIYSGGAPAGATVVIWTGGSGEERNNTRTDSFGNVYRFIASNGISLFGAYYCTLANAISAGGTLVLSAMVAHAVAFSGADASDIDWLAAAAQDDQSFGTASWDVGPITAPTTPSLAVGAAMLDVLVNGGTITAEVEGWNVEAEPWLSYQDGSFGNTTMVPCWRSVDAGPTRFAGTITYSHFFNSYNLFPDFHVLAGVEPEPEPEPEPYVKPAFYGGEPGLTAAVESTAAGSGGECATVSAVGSGGGESLSLSAGVSAPISGCV